MAFERRVRDLRLAMRTLVRQPEFTLTAVLILALGIGATTAMFSVTNTLVLQPLPYPEPERLVRLYRTVEKDRGFPNPHSQSAYEDYRRLGTVFEDATAYVAVQAKVAARPGDDGGRRVSALRVTSSYFAVHGLRPLLGRALAPGDDRLGGARSVVLSWRFWQNELGGDPDVVGRTVRIEDETHTVVGVMPREFNDLRRFWARVELWYPLQLGPPPPRDHENRWLQVVARLQPGQAVKVAQAELDALTERLNAQHGTRGGVHVVPLGETGVNQAETRATQLTLWLAVVVLLIACFNLAGLQLARLASRQHEQAIRAALGAGRGRLVRQLLVESMLLCLAGGALGLLLAMWATDVISARLVLFGTPAGLAINLDGRVLAVASAAVALTTLCVGLWPALAITRASVADTLRAGGRGTTDRGQPRLRHALVVAELALAVVLLAAGGLFVRGLDRFVEEGQGWKVDGLLVGNLALPRAPEGPQADQRTDQRIFIDRLQATLERLPSVERASLSTGLPMSNFAFTQPFLVDGRPAPPPGRAPVRYFDVVSPGHFATLGLSLERGGDFHSSDGPDSEPVLIINQAMARALWPGEDPIGKRVGAAVGEPRFATIIGVVSDARIATELREPITRFRTYRPLSQEPPRPWVVVAARIRTSPTTALAELRAAIAGLDPTHPPFDAKRVRESVDIAMSNLKLLASILFGFAVLGLVLAALGIYGLFSGFVVQRTREIGLRMALGARSDQVLWLILARGLRLSAVGAVLGLAGAAAALRVLTATASELPAYDPATIAVLGLALAAVALFACWLPARRAAALDPMVALRQE
jgi:putative ABC transport system permease protein